MSVCGALCVCVNAHRGTAGMMTHEEKLARGRAILAAYRTWLRCVVAVRGAARRCEVWLMRVCVCVCVCVLTLNPKP